MSGQKSTASHSDSGRKLHSNRSGRNAGADVRRPSQSNPRSGVSDSSVGSSGSRTLGAAQRQWPEYNRAIFIVSTCGTAAVIVAAVARAVTG